MILRGFIAAGTRPLCVRVPLGFILFLGALVLLPWCWFPPFPWLHVHAQWSDALFAGAAGLWAIERWRAGARPRLRALHGAMVLYLGAAAVSLLASPAPRAGLPKWIGMAELCALTIVASDFLRRPETARAAARAIAATSIVVGAAAILGVCLFYAGIPTRLVGKYGDLLPGAYARAQAGLYHPNLLGNYCLFASAVIAQPAAALPRRLRRLAQGALVCAVLLTLSRAILAFGLGAAIRAARTPARRRVAAVYGALALGALLFLALVPIVLNPAHPLDLRLDPGHAPSRRQSVTSSLRTFAAHPLSGSGFGTHPGSKDGEPFDAHLTPLNIAATLGLPALCGFAAIPLLLWRGRCKPTRIALWSGMAALGFDALSQDIEDFRQVWLLFGWADAARAVADTAGTAERSMPTHHDERLSQ